MDKKPIVTKRIYENPSENDGFRVLVDRIWPRGVSKEEAKLDEWMKEIAPSTKLRKWFDHDPNKFEKFKERYGKELDNKPQVLNKLIEMSSGAKVTTLLYAAKDKRHNHARVLKKYLENR